jgi:small subunit ribosomal protein S2
MSAVPKFSMKQLLDAGVHFGHKTMRWNPAMAPYIYGERNNIHIINLQKTVPLLYQALEVARDVAANNGRILFVGTKPQAAEIVAEAAKRCGQYYVNHRWLGGTLTNWPTVSQSIRTMTETRAQLEDPEIQIGKKERLQLTRKLEKLDRTLGGIQDMGGKPDLLFVIDTSKEHIAVLEAQKLGIPIIGIVDTNCSPDGINYIVPGNDDSLRSITLYCSLIAESILAGLQASLGKRAAAKDEKPASNDDLKAGKKGDKAGDKRKPAGKKEEEAEPKKAEVVKKVSKKPAKAEGDNVASIADVKAGKDAGTGEAKVVAK